MAEPTETPKRPDNTIAEVWRDYRRWAADARLLKQRQEHAHYWTLGLGVAGAVLATLAGLCEDLRPALSLLSALSIALAGYLGRELLSPQSDSAWWRCRLLAEALQRLVWLALMEVKPYQGAKAADALKEKAQSLVKAVNLTHVGTEDETKALPTCQSVDDYIGLRLQPQIDWYRKRVSEMQASLGRWRRGSFALGFAAIVLGVLGSQAWPWATRLIPIITCISGAIMTLLQFWRFQSLAPLYQQTEEQLRLELAAWKDGGQQDGGKFIQAVEEIMARENGSWRAEWMTKSEHSSKDAGNGRPKAKAAGHPLP